MVTEKMIATMESAARDHEIYPEGMQSVFERIQLMLDAGGSPRGISYWTKAAACGRAAQLEIAQRMERERLGESSYAAADDSSKLNFFTVGVTYHLLHELLGDYPELPPSYAGSVYTFEFVEGLRLFRAYRNMWGSIREKWGFESMQLEMDLPTVRADPELASKLYGLPRGTEVTGRADVVGYIPPHAVEGVCERTGVILPGPGKYILDLKTASRDGGDRYSDSLQAINYLALYNEEFPGEPALGMIFDQIVKTKVPKFQHFLAQACDVDPERVGNLVRIGLHNLKGCEGRGICNPVGCSDWRTTCYWRTSGQCPGY